MRGLISVVLSLCAGVGVLYGLTDGFTALTAETARRQAVALTTPVVPDVLLLSQDDQRVSFRRELADDGRVAIVVFFYTRCVSLCLAQGFVTERLQNAINVSGLQSKIRLVSISFDPRDGLDDLRRYATRMNANPSIWSFWSMPDARQRHALLSLFGITVVPAPLGEFVHNAAFHVVGPDGRLRLIVDEDEPGLALQKAQELVTQIDRRGAQ